MASTTSPFAFPYPEGTDLVRNGATDIQNLAEGVNDYLAGGYVYAGTRYYTSSGTFAKADPLGTGDIGLRAIRVRVQGAGGGGGQTQYTVIGAAAAGAGGSGGAYAESFITDIASLAASVTVTRGAGGAAGIGGTVSVGAGTDATNGGDSSFGSGAAYEVSAAGGLSGISGADFTDFLTRPGSLSATTGTGDVVVPGSASMGSWSSGSAVSSRIVAFSSAGGDSVFGAGGRMNALVSTGNNAANGVAGTGFGSGGGGAATVAGASASDGSDGGAGANGIVIIDCFV